MTQVILTKDVPNDRGHKERCSDFNDVTLANMDDQLILTKDILNTEDMRKVAVNLMMSLLPIWMTQLILTKDVLNDRGHEEGCSDFNNVTLAIIDDPSDIDKRCPQ